MAGLKIGTAILAQHCTSLSIIMSWYEVMVRGRGQAVSVILHQMTPVASSRPQIKLCAFITMTIKIRAMKVSLDHSSNSNNMYLALNELESVIVIILIIIVVIVIIIIVNSNNNNTCRQGRVSLGYPIRSSPT